jgi:hyperosmotically inducible periplasmic protein
MREQWGTAGEGQALPHDQDLEREVSRRVHDDPELQLYAFQVSVADGRVTLAGHLPSAELRHRAEALAAGVRGVREVTNNIVVTEAPA